ncbi:hypothetical protein EE612_009156 [Oryza sativa]|nr:hypothetical protein EE612_009156 [Oryza sativa]
MELGLLLAPSPGAPTSMAGRTVRNSIDATGGGTLRQVRSFR